VTAELDRGNPSIRAAGPSDLEQVLGLARRCGLLEPGIADAVERYAMATVTDRVVGVCGLENYGEAGLLRTLGVDADYRRRGVGRRLVEWTLARGRVEGMKTTYLLTTTGQAFFERFGFVNGPRSAAPSVIRHSWEFRAGCPSSATLMWRVI
jgi:amino-acid N-acetyltransferase